MDQTAAQKKADATASPDSVAQECIKPEPQKEHLWLQQLVGQWICEGEAVMQPGQEPVKWTGSETVRAIGGLWIVGEGKSDTSGGESSETIITLGYDPRKGCFTGTFVASMMTHLWIYEGELDAAGTVLTLTTDGPGMKPDAPYAKYRDVVEIKSPDHRTLTSYIFGDDGQWQRLMEVSYRRR